LKPPFLSFFYFILFFIEQKITGDTSSTKKINKNKNNSLLKVSKAVDKGQSNKKQITSRNMHINYKYNKQKES